MSELTIKERVRRVAGDIATMRAAGMAWKSVRGAVGMEDINLPSFRRAYNRLGDIDEEGDEEVHKEIVSHESDDPRRAMAESAGVPEQYVHGGWVKDERYSVRVSFPSAPIDYDALLGRWFDRLASLPPLPPLPPLRMAGQHALVFPASDLHLGSLGVGGETLRDTVRRFRQTVDAGCAEAITRNYTLQRIIIPSLGDIIHTDGYGAVTRKGTPQDVSALPEQMSEAAADCLEYMVRRCATLAPVDLIFVPGNHDWNSTHWLALVMEARFHSSEHVTVHRSKTPRKYMRYGTTLMAFDHGHDLKPAVLHQTVNTEAADLMAGMTHIVWWRGHLHGRALETRGNMQVRTVSALAHLDRWHKEKGYFAYPAGELHFIHHEKSAGGIIPVYPTETEPTIHELTRPKEAIA